MTDRLSAFDSVLETAVPHKGAVLNGLANFWFEKTRHIIPNHVLKLVDANAMLVKEAQPIKVEMIVRNYITGSMLRGYQQGQRTFSGVTVPDGLRKHQQFPEPIVTPTTKEESDREITPENLVSEGWVSQELYDQMKENRWPCSGLGPELLAEKGIILVDTKYEFGLLNGELILIDEIHTPDSSRFWSAEDYARNPETAEQMDKEYVRQWLIANKQDGQYPRALTPEVAQRSQPPLPRHLPAHHRRGPAHGRARHRRRARHRPPRRPRPPAGQPGSRRPAERCLGEHRDGLARRPGALRENPPAVRGLQHFHAAARDLGPQKRRGNRRHGRHLEPQHRARRAHRRGRPQQRPGRCAGRQRERARHLLPAVEGLRRAGHEPELVGGDAQRARPTSPWCAPTTPPRLPCAP